MEKIVETKAKTFSGGKIPSKIQQFAKYANAGFPEGYGISEEELFNAIPEPEEVESRLLVMPTSLVISGKSINYLYPG